MASGLVPNTVMILIFSIIVLRVRLSGLVMIVVFLGYVQPARGGDAEADDENEYLELPGRGEHDGRHAEDDAHSVENADGLLLTHAHIEQAVVEVPASCLGAA